MNKYGDLLVRPGREVKIRGKVGKTGVQVTGHYFALGSRFLSPANTAGPIDAGLRPLWLQHVPEKGRSHS